MDDPIAALEANFNCPGQNWGNRWMCFPCSRLNAFAGSAFRSDMRSDKHVAIGPQRRDINRFVFYRTRYAQLRIPVSCLFRLGLANAMGQDEGPALVRTTTEAMMGHFFNDNTPPKTHFFIRWVDRVKGGRYGCKASQ